MAADEAEKTEPATPKRREDARQKGEVAQSRDLPGVTILAMTLLAGSSVVGVGLIEAMARVAVASWGGAARPPGSLTDFHTVLVHHIGWVGLAVLPLFGLLFATAAVTQLMQVGPMFSLEAMQPKSERMNVLKGLKRIVSPEKLVDLAKAALKISIVISIAAWVVRAEIAAVLSLSAAGLGTGLGVAGGLAREVAIAVLGALAVLAGFDVAYQRWRHEKKLRMSKQEVRDEAKQREGSPQVRSRFRARRLELNRQRMIASVADADVVVTNPTHYAVALKYERAAMGAPRVVAKGRGYVAGRIREVAHENGVPIVENPPLARTLHRTGEVGREVPEALYQAVAEVLAYVFRLRPGRHRGWSPGP